MATSSLDPTGYKEHSWPTHNQMISSPDSFLQLADINLVCVFSLTFNQEHRRIYRSSATGGADASTTCPLTGTTFRKPHLDCAVNTVHCTDNLPSQNINGLKIMLNLAYSSY